MFYVLSKVGPESYLGALLLDASGRRASLSGEVDVIFTIKLGKRVVHTISTNRPYEDGVFYFENVKRYKVLNLLNNESPIEENESQIMFKRIM